MKYNLKFFANDNEEGSDTPQRADKNNKKNSDGPVLKVTQKELNEIIKSRLARERARLLPQAADYEAYKNWQENQEAQVQAERQAESQLNETINENAQLKKKLCAMEKGIDSGVIDFAVFQAERMVNEELNFCDALELLIFQQPHIFGSMKNINTGIKHSQTNTAEGNAALKDAVFEKMGVRKV